MALLSPPDRLLTRLLRGVLTTLILTMTDGVATDIRDAVLRDAGPVSGRRGAEVQQSAATAEGRPPMRDQEADEPVRGPSPLKCPQGTSR